MEKQQATDFVLERIRNNHSRDQIVTELRQAMKAPEAMLARFVDSIIAEYAVAPFEAEINIDEQALAAFVTDSIAKLRDSDDILYDICLRTGWNWKKAHDFLVNIQSSQLTKVQKSENRLLLPLGIVLILAGSALTYLLMNKGFLILPGIATLVGGVYATSKALRHKPT
ncbi:MAG: hypothetical protein H8E28_14070 [Anaerolineae bacterium]|nr:hypothetical protein [Anaerolineae bacterium]MBL6966726.1 hypothetical protein [Anaerolineales bacterium]